MDIFPWELTYTDLSYCFPWKEAWALPFHKRCNRVTIYLSFNYTVNLFIFQDFHNTALLFGYQRTLAYWPLKHSYLQSCILSQRLVYSHILYPCARSYFSVMFWDRRGGESSPSKSLFTWWFALIFDNFLSFFWNLRHRDIAKQSTSIF